ncbi:MAG: lysophospholipid acyltransferase family protein [Rhizobiaceae bacterium]|nr:lysophospholipid acyltransferase family protein [Rhizobiaceae bacterium]
MKQQSLKSSEKRGAQRSRPLKNAWRKIRKPLAESRVVKAALTGLLAGAVRFVRFTNPPVKGSVSKMTPEWAALEPAIMALWHGQHILAPAFYPSSRKLVAMVSKSADAELNAKVLERFGVATVRGSGGRLGANNSDKGGARALIQLKKALDTGSNVCMIADIPHGTPRDAGEGIILLARISGRPIIPAAIATSRRKVLHKSWDKTTINLPFGRGILHFGKPIHVPADADAKTMEARRRDLTDALNETFDTAYKMVGGRP